MNHQLPRHHRSLLNAGGSAHPPLPPDLCPARSGRVSFMGPGSCLGGHPGKACTPAASHQLLHPPRHRSQDGRKGQRSRRCCLRQWQKVPEPTSSGGGLDPVPAAPPLALPSSLPSIILSYKHLSLFLVRGCSGDTEAAKGTCRTRCPACESSEVLMCVFHG